MTTGVNRSLEAEAGLALLRAMFRVKGHFHDSVADSELSGPVAGALLLLDESMPMSELAQRIGCDPSYITGIADRLEELALAERKPMPEDRRVKRLVLTPEGKERADTIAARAFDANPFLEKLGAGDLRTLIQVLARGLDTH